MASIKFPHWYSVSLRCHLVNFHYISAIFQFCLSVVLYYAELLLHSFLHHLFKERTFLNKSKLPQFYRISQPHIVLKIYSEGRKHHI